MALIKTMTIDDYYSSDEAQRLSIVAANLQYSQYEFGKEVDNFNMVADNADELFSKALRMKVSVIKERSGVFRMPENFIHFEGFDSTNEWIFVVALDKTTFNIFEHNSGAVTALNGYNFNYRNLFEWDVTVNYQLKPGQGVLYRPWLFHTFHTGIIQLFRLEQHDD